MYWTRFGLYIWIERGWLLAPAGDSRVKWTWRLMKKTVEVWHV
jgi:hypothetical protein